MVRTWTAIFISVTAAGAQNRLETGGLSVAIADGGYQIGSASVAGPVLTSQVGAQIDGQWLRARDYPRHEAAASSFEDALGKGKRLVITHSGLAGRPDLLCALRLYDSQPYGDIELTVRNPGSRTITVQGFSLVDAAKVSLGGPNEANRVVTDSFSENRPIMQIYDLAKPPRGGMHWGSNSQLIYNRQSGKSLFVGAVTSRRMLTILRLAVQNSSISSYTVDSTGTTEVQLRSFLARAPKEDVVELSLPVEPGKALSSERIMFAVGADYHAQLEAYGAAIRVLFKARIPEENLMGWWSWTALYSGLSHGTAMTNANWLASNLKSLGYEYFHFDEGFQYARGEYTTADAARFPHGIRPVAQEVARMGLKMGIWTAPFEISLRSSVYEQHKDWLVRNSAGQPLKIGTDITGADPLYALDTTHPGAQDYLRHTYHVLAREWGVRYIKMDFMDETAVEGRYYRPHTTALEAQQIGLGIIREAVGDEVNLDKDGSPMLNAVGYVDSGRISIDTAHSFDRIKRALPGIAARYYMHRNFFLNDPDGFVLSTQLTGETRPADAPLTLNEARVSIALAAVSGGMFELGDDLPTLGAQPERLALATNPELLRMAKLSRASTPLDLMSYPAEDQQPSVFFLKQSRRQSILTVFNWTDAACGHSFTFAGLKLPTGGRYRAYDVFESGKTVALRQDGIDISAQPGRSVQMIKIVDESVAAAAPLVTVQAPSSAVVGEEAKFTAAIDTGGVPALSYSWKFGDGTMARGSRVAHTYTWAGDYTAELAVEGVDGLTARKTVAVKVSGVIQSPFPLSKSRRFIEK